MLRRTRRRIQPRRRDVVSELIGYELHHVGIVVADIDAAAQKYAALGFPGGERFEMTEQGVIAVTYHTGPGYVELIQPTNPEGAIAKFMAKRGEGMHHVAYRVTDLGYACAARCVRYSAHRCRPPSWRPRLADRLCAS